MLPGLVLAVGLLATVAAALLVSLVLRQQEAERFANAVDQAQSAIAARMDAYVSVLHAGAGLMAAEGEAIDRARFDAFASTLQLEQVYPGIQGLGYSARLPEVDGPATRDLLEGLGAPDVRVRPAHPRRDVHAVVFLQPLDARNRAALGFDMYSHPVRRAAMDRARDTGQTSISRKVSLVQEITPDKQAGFLIYHPVYEGGASPPSLEERRRRLRGFVYAAFRADDLLAGIFRGQTQPRLHIAVFDQSVAPENLLHKSFADAPGDLAEASRFQEVRRLPLAGGLWQVAYYSRPGLERSEALPLLWAFIVGGVLTSVIMAAASLWQVRARAAAEAEVAARRAGQSQRDLLLGELNHRVKNTLATVQSIAAQTLREGKSLRDTRETFESRILALSQTHNLLTEGHWRGVGLADLVRLELAPYRGQGEGRLVADGPEITVPPTVAVALGMALHELATNAAKYGALSAAGGRVLVSWRVRPDEARSVLVLDWCEEGGPPVVPPAEQGFGTRLITQGLRRQLNGRVQLDFPPAGLRCRIEAPLEPPPA
jgi:two-component sensor histidine kinase/CHASE1-domain containing sensor protein